MLYIGESGMDYPLVAWRAFSSKTPKRANMQLGWWVQPTTSPSQLGILIKFWILLRRISEYKNYASMQLFKSLRWNIWQRTDSSCLFSHNSREPTQTDIQTKQIIFKVKVCRHCVYHGLVFYKSVHSQMLNTTESCFLSLSGHLIMILWSCGIGSDFAFV